METRLRERGPFGNFSPLAEVRRNWAEELPEPKGAHHSRSSDAAPAPRPRAVPVGPFGSSFAGLEEELHRRVLGFGDFEQAMHAERAPPPVLPLTQRFGAERLWQTAEAPAPLPVLLASEASFSPQDGHVRIIMPEPLEGGKLGLVVKHLTVAAITDVQASQFGFFVGDRILAVNDNPVGSTAEFIREVANAMRLNQVAGMPVAFDVWRKGSSRKTHPPVTPPLSATPMASPWGATSFALSGSPPSPSPAASFYVPGQVPAVPEAPPRVAPAPAPAPTPAPTAPSRRRRACAC